MIPSPPPVDLRAAIKKLDSLPAMPIIAQKLLTLKLNTDVGEQQMLLLIAQDAQISAKLIGLANTPMMGTSRKITSVKHAAMVLGLPRVRTVAMGIAIISLMKKPAGRFDLQDLWLHNMGVAFGMLAIAHAMPAHIRPHDDHIFLTGMMHDIGYLALAFLDHHRSDALHEKLNSSKSSLALDIERAMLDITHDESGAELAKHWHFPEEIISAIRHHHTPENASHPQGKLLAQLANLTEKLLPSFSLSETIDLTVNETDWLTLGIAPEQIEETKSLVADQAEQALQFFNNFG